MGTRWFHSLGLKCELLKCSSLRDHGFEHVFVSFFSRRNSVFTYLELIWCGCSWSTFHTTFISFYVWTLFHLYRIRSILIGKVVISVLSNWSEIAIWFSHTWNEEKMDFLVNWSDKPNIFTLFLRFLDIFRIFEVFMKLNLGMKMIGSGVVVIMLENVKTNSNKIWER